MFFHFNVIGVHLSVILYTGTFLIIMMCFGIDSLSFVYVAFFFFFLYLRVFHIVLLISVLIRQIAPYFWSLFSASINL